MTKVTSAILAMLLALAAGSAFAADATGNGSTDNMQRGTVPDSPAQSG